MWLDKGCPVFKKYDQFNVGSETTEEYVMLKYCNAYMSKYIYRLCVHYAMGYFNLAFLYTLCTNPYFRKFIKSGSLKYINIHFFLLFREQTLVCLTNSNKNLESFVEKYFQIYIHGRFKADLLKVFMNSVNKTAPKTFHRSSGDRIKMLFDQGHFLWNDHKAFFNALEVSNKVLENSPYFGFDAAVADFTFSETLVSFKPGLCGSSNKFDKEIDNSLASAVDFLNCKSFFFGCSQTVQSSFYERKDGATKNYIYISIEAFIKVLQEFDSEIYEIQVSCHKNKYFKKGLNPDMNSISILNFEKFIKILDISYINYSSKGPISFR